MNNMGNLKNADSIVWNDVLIISCMILLLGCNNTIDPFNEEKGSYSLYGYLNLNKDVNYIRVKNLNQPLTEEATREMDATVILQNLDNNTTVTLQDSIVKFDGVYTHNFYTSLDIKPETKYLIEVEGSNGKNITATAITPRIAEVTAEPTGENCDTPITITFDPVINRHSLELSIGFDYESERHWTNVTVQAGEGESVLVRFKPIEILSSVFPPDQMYGEAKVRCHDLDHNNFYVRYTHYGPGFIDDIHGSTGSNTTIRFGGLNKESFSFPIDTARIES